MDNQHRHIKGYRELTPEDIELMNAIKQKGAELLALHKQVVDRNHDTHTRAVLRDDHATLQHLEDSQPQRWASIARTDIQTGVMALVRAVAQPLGV